MPARKAKDDGLIRIEYMPLSSRQPAKRNPKLHALEDIKKSMRRFGFTMPGAVDENTGRMFAGHGRGEALDQLKSAGEEPPKRIIERDGEWYIPVLRGIAFESEDEAEAYLIADNKLTELGGYDEGVMAQMLADLDKALGKDAFVGIGIDEKETSRLLASLTGSSGGGGSDPDDVPDAPAEPISQRGDLWILGDHRLLCGDSTNGDDVSRLMNGERAGLMNTDPPYGIAYVDNANSKGQAEGFSEIENDDLDGEKLQSFLESVIRTAIPHLADATAFYLWHPMLTQGTFFAAAAADILIHRQIIWVKPSLVFGRGDYHWRHELCFYGWVKGKRPPFYGERNQTTIWEIGRENDKVHPTQKPVDLFAIPMRNHTKPGELCYEPFSGSGSQIIAAEQLGRRCFAMELEPRYVDVAVARWEKFTGRKAYKE